MRKALHGARHSHDFYRFKLPVPVQLDEGTRGHTTQLAEDWMEMRIDKVMKEGMTLSLTAHMPAGPQALTMNVATVRDGICSGPLCWKSTAARDALAASLYSVDWHREFLHRHADFMAPSDLLLSPWRPRPAREQWHAVLLADAAGHFNHYGILSESDQDEEEASLIAFIPLENKKSYEALIFRSNITVRANVTIGASTGLHSLANEGLDGAVPRRWQVKVGMVSAD